MVSRIHAKASNPAQVARETWYHLLMSMNDLEFAYSPVRDQVRDLREYL